jgi:Zn-dependent protease
MRKWVLIGRIRSTHISLYAHWTVLLAALVFVAGAIQSPAYAAVALGSLIVLVIGHEAGHALIANRLGYDVEAIRFSLVHGACEFEAPDTEWDAVLIAWGGVAMQVAIAIPVLLVDAFWRGSLGLFGPVVVILGYYSLVVAAFNLVPAEGLDGKEAWRIIPLLRSRAKARRVAKGAIRRARGR